MSVVATGFIRGYCCAVATLIAGHGDGQEVTDLLLALNVTPSLLNQLDPYDASQIRTTSYWKQRFIDR